VSSNAAATTISRFGFMYDQILGFRFFMSQILNLVTKTCRRGICYPSCHYLLDMSNIFQDFEIKAKCLNYVPGWWRRCHREVWKFPAKTFHTSRATPRSLFRSTYFYFSILFSLVFISSDVLFSMKNSEITHTLEIIDRC
jgi:hypothetical protein